MSDHAVTARAEILARAERVLLEPGLLFRGERPHRSLPPAPVTSAESSESKLAKRFGEKLEALSGSYEVLGAAEVAGRVAELARRWSLGQETGAGVDASSTPVEVLSWAPSELSLPDIERALRERAITMVVPDDLHTAECRKRASESAVGITGVDAAFASTGSVLLVSAPGKSRAASLLPLHHIMLVPLSRVYPTFETWAAECRRAGRLAQLLQESGQVVFVTGPSKSADIELNLTLGVHGPGVVHAIVFDDAG